LSDNIARADAVAGTAAHNLSTSRDAAGNTLGLAWETNGDILELGPREVLLPKVKPRREAPTSRRGVFLRCSLLPAAIDQTALLYRRHHEHATDGPENGSVFAAIESLRH
jgi:hypothetical protein